MHEHIKISFSNGRFIWSMPLTLYPFGSGMCVDCAPSLGEAMDRIKRYLKSNAEAKQRHEQDMIRVVAGY